MLEKLTATVVMIISGKCERQWTLNLWQRIDEKQGSYLVLKYTLTPLKGKNST